MFEQCPACERHLMSSKPSSLQSLQIIMQHQPMILPQHDVSKASTTLEYRSPVLRLPEHSGRWHLVLNGHCWLEWSSSQPTNFTCVVIPVSSSQRSQRAGIGERRIVSCTCFWVNAAANTLLTRRASMISAPDDMKLSILPTRKTWSKT